MDQETFAVSLGEERFTVPKKVADISQYFHNILSLGIDEEEIVIDPKIIDKETFQYFLNFCTLNNYEEPTVGRKIRTNNLQEVLDQKNYEFIKEFPLQSQKLMKLYGAAHFLVCRGLKLVIAAIYACKIYFEDRKEAYIQKKKQLGIPEDMEITFEDEQKFRQQYYVDESMKE